MHKKYQLTEATSFYENNESCLMIFSRRQQNDKMKKFEWMSINLQPQLVYTDIISRNSFVITQKTVANE